MIANSFNVKSLSKRLKTSLNQMSILQSIVYCNTHYIVIHTILQCNIVSNATY